MNQMRNALRPSLGGPAGGPRPCGKGMHHEIADFVNVDNYWTDRRSADLQQQRGGRDYPRQAGSQGTHGFGNAESLRELELPSAHGPHADVL